MASEINEDQIRRANELMARDKATGNSPPYFSRSLPSQADTQSGGNFFMKSANASTMPQTTPTVSQKPNPAMQSLGKFGSMINKNIAQPIANAMNYANPVTFTRNLWNAAGQLPQTIKQIDSNYGNRVRSDLAEINRKSGSPFPTPTNQQIAQSVQNPEMPGGIVYGSPEWNANIKQYQEGTNALNAQIDQAEAAHPNLQSTANYDENQGVAGNQTDAANHMIANSAPSAGNYQTDLPGNTGPNLPYALPKGNALPEAPDAAYSNDGQALPSFDNRYMESNYADLNNKKANDELFGPNGRYVQERLAQNNAAKQVAENINRETRLMADLRQSRSGVRDGSGPTLGGTTGNKYAPTMRVTNDKPYESKEPVINPEHEQQQFENDLKLKQLGLDMRDHALNRQKANMPNYKHYMTTDMETGNESPVFYDANNPSNIFNQNSPKMPQINIDQKTIVNLARARADFMKNPDDPNNKSAYDAMLAKLGLNDQILQNLLSQNQG